MVTTDSTDGSGTQGANPGASQPPVQQNSFDPDKFAKDLEARILAAVRDPREVQSLKDRTIAEIKKDKGLRDAFAELKAMQAEGLSDREIETQIKLRELEERLGQSSAAPSQSPGKAVEPSTNDPVNAFISAAKLDQNDPDVIQALEAEGLAERMVALANIVQRKQKPVNPAAVMQPAGGGAPTPSADQLTTMYKKEVMANRGNRAAIVEIQQKYREQGLDIGSVVLSV